MKSEIKRLPELFLERLKSIVPQQKWGTIVNSFSENKPTTFRVNTLKASADILKEKLEHQGFLLEKVHWLPAAFILKRGTLRELQKTDTYLTGEIYVQALSSMLPPLVVNPQPGETILDMTAAPGSKTTQLACLMKGEGKIIANDNNKIRFFKLKANVELQSASNVEVCMQGGELFGRQRPNFFDKVLLDAPCSAEGRFDVFEPASYKYWKPAKIKEMSRKQKMLFASAFHTLKPGGSLVYSTCTFAPEENEAVLDWAFGKFGDQMQLEKIYFPFPNQAPGLGKWLEKEFNPAVRTSLRILPSSQMEAFFIAKIKKNNVIPAEAGIHGSPLKACGDDKNNYFK